MMTTNSMKEKIMEIPPSLVWALIVIGIVLAVVIIAFSGTGIKIVDFIQGYISKILMPVTAS